MGLVVEGMPPWRGWVAQALSGLKGSRWPVKYKPRGNTQTQSRRHWKKKNHKGARRAAYSWWGMLLWFRDPLKVKFSIPPIHTMLPPSLITPLPNYVCVAYGKSNRYELWWNLNFTVWKKISYFFVLNPNNVFLYYWNFYFIRLEIPGT